MTKDLQNMEERIRQIFRKHGDRSEYRMDDFLGSELASLEPADKIRTLDRLIERFEGPGPNSGEHAGGSPGVSIDDHVLGRVIKLLLGRDISQVDLSSEELLESLADSINTVFESLNQVISVINTTLVGKQDSDQTIRQVIGFHLEGSDRARPLESYIGQIGKAFFEAQEAAKKAAHAKVMQILEELSPEKIEKEAGVSKLTPMRKSRYYEEYELKFGKFEKWFESGRFMESFLREFEKNCQKISI
ncbi:type VI secretion system-associated FHA domain protein [Desulfospira joergensenii]|uniref:type VI secretion system-associated FHA domain protein n=1 Tax=Desulfospira joergensenii TaxID=53329 RepID=UPI0003B56DE0|nr:type VI secretion system-associated FHA domain protein [Desulfospira joergensenii]